MVLHIQRIIQRKFCCMALFFPYNSNLRLKGAQFTSSRQLSYTLSVLSFIFSLSSFLFPSLIFYILVFFLSFVLLDFLSYSFLFPISMRD